MKLTAQIHIEKMAYELRDHAHAVIKNVLLMSNISTLSLQLAMRELAQHSRVALHFHPDQIDNRGLTVMVYCEMGCTKASLKPMFLMVIYHLS